MQKKAFRIVAGFLLIAVAEIAAAAFIMYCKNSAEVRGIEILFIILAGTAPAMLFEKMNAAVGEVVDNTTLQDMVDWQNGITE